MCSCLFRHIYHLLDLLVLAWPPFCQLYQVMNNPFGASASCYICMFEHAYDGLLACLYCWLHLKVGHLIDFDEYRDIHSRGSCK
jgi:hypothetical protein